MRFIALDKLINLYDGYRKQCVVNRRELLLIQENNELFLIQSSCPHMHWPLITADIHKKSIRCTKHGMSFNLVTGGPDNHAAKDCRWLTLYPIAYEGDSVGVKLSDLIGDPELRIK